MDISKDDEMERQKWSRGMDGNVTQKTLVEILDHGDPQFYPGVYAVVIILLTYPVSTCTTERSFSNTKILKMALTKYHDRQEIELFSNFAHSQAQGC